jgi:ribosome biogenesis GTPase / thiamine phosphate phosphatase
VTSQQRRWDEDDVRVRPQRGKSRPRSKERPRHTDATDGFVVAVDRGRFTCRLGDPHDERVGTELYAVKSRELGRKGVVVGDNVALVGDLSGRTDTLARIVRVRRRGSVLRRTADDTDKVERVLVANADQLAVVVAVADPVPRPRLIDRCLVAAYDAGLDPLLLLTKSDLADPDALLSEYGGLDVPYVVTGRVAGGLTGVEAARERLAGRVSVMVGHSGVGKSTLVNALVPDADRSTGVVNVVTGRGRHTSTSAVALALQPSGWVVDTPGVRSFGVAHVNAERLLEGFPELAAGTTDCPRGCTHDEPECGLDPWVAAGHAAPARLDSFRRLLRALRGTDDVST